ncbi:MAG TPA: hypothetical protein VNH11_24345 [Pirellulales bacterium]|nr:hypothetical protein [Pirellulales bacterium]
MEPYTPQPDGDEEEWQRWRAERARRREERAKEERAIQEQLGESKGAAINGLLCVIIAIGFANFTCFWLADVAIGGSAANGKVEGGKFYAGSHGKYTEVSKAVFDYSRIHGYSIWTTKSDAKMTRYRL